MSGIRPEASERSFDPAGLVDRARKGDESAWVTLVREYGPRVFALAKSRLGGPEAAEEVTQSVFATLAIKLREGGYAEHGRFEPWLFRIAMNRVRDRVRALQRESNEIRLRLVAKDEAAEDGAAQGTGADEAGIGELRESLAELNDADREVIELRYHAAMSFKEMAALLDEPLGTLLARHHRALRKLKKRLEDGERRNNNATDTSGDPPPRGATHHNAREPAG